MQWLIDIIVDVVKTQIGYFDRGDPATWDWELSGLIADGNWHDLNLAAIVPSGARLVRFQLTFRATNSNARFQLRENGNSNVSNVASIRNNSPNFYIDDLFLVAPDADRIVEYRIVPSGTNFLRLTVCGWWL